MAEEKPNRPTDPTIARNPCSSGPLGNISIADNKAQTQYPSSGSGLSQIATEINNAAAALEAMTDCEAIKEVIRDAVSDIVDLTSEIGNEISEIVGIWLPILNVPRNPLKIIKWAIKVATGPAGAQILAVASLAIELALVAGAIARMAGAVSTASRNLKNCTEDALLDALDEITCNLLGDASELLNLTETIIGDYEELGNLKGLDLLEALSSASPSSDIAKISDSIISIDTSISATDSELNRLQGLGG